MKKSIKIIAGVFVFFAFIFLIIAIFILFLGNDKENSKLVKDNYYVDDNNVKINNSELISEKHFPKNSKSKDLEISISEMVINSTYQSEDKMDVVAYLNNETENELNNIKVDINFIDNKGKKIESYSVDVDYIDKRGIYLINFQASENVVNAYDYEFTYVID